jgi:hypothetical protein
MKEQIDDPGFNVLMVITEWKKLPKGLPASIIMEMTLADFGTLEETRSDQEYAIVCNAIIRRIQTDIRLREYERKERNGGE